MSNCLIALLCPIFENTGVTQKSFSLKKEVTASNAVILI